MTACCNLNGDISVIRGNNYPPLMWQFLESEDPDVLFDLTGSTFKLRIVWPGGTVTKSSDLDADLTIDYVNSVLAWAYAADWSRSLPLGRLPRYEVERWIGGTQQSMVEAFLVVSQGNNPD